MAATAFPRVFSAFVISVFVVTGLLLGAFALAADDGLRGSVSLWLGGSDGAVEIAADDDGALVTRIEHPPHGFTALAVDEQTGALWALGRTAVHQYDLDGDLRHEIALPGPGRGFGEPPVAMVHDPVAGGVRVLRKRQWLHVGPEGQVLATAELPRGQGVAHALAAGRVAGQTRVWVSTSRSVLTYDADGALLDTQRMRRSPRVMAWEPVAGRLLMATRLRLLSHDPASGDTRQRFSPGIEYLAADGSGGLWAGGGVHLLQLDSELRLTGYRFALFDLLSPVLGMATALDSAGVWLLGSHRAVLIDAGVARAHALELPGPQRWRDLAVHVPAEPPRLSVLAPPSGSWTGNPRPVFHLAWEPGSAAVDPETLAATIAGDDALLELACETQTADEALCRPAEPLDDGYWQFDFTVADAAGRTSAPAHLDLNIDTVPPAIPDAALIEIIVNDDGTVTVTGEAGAVEPGSEITVTNTETGDSVTVQADSDGAFSATLAAEAGDALEITASDAAGNTSDPVERPVSGPLPPDPASVAPPVENGVATNVYDSTRFLYAGSNPVQQDVAPDAITPERAAVVRGRVLDADGQPLPGVTVSINNKPHLGHTLTREDGRFDMAVNGGGPVVINYDKEDYLPAQRRVRPDWQGWAHVDDVVLIGLDPNVTSVALGDSETQVAAGSQVADEDGARRAVVVFPAGTQATMTLPDGSEQPLASINVRATEYTVGERGPERMPGELPPTSGYTYAVELSADEAIAAGGSRVNFDRPLPFYVDNFLDFPTGGIVPAGWYDRERAAWVPSDNGRVIEVLAIENGLAVLDVAGEGEPATAEELAELGIDEAELAVLAERYAPGDSLWRTPVEHFTPWDCNWPFGPPDDAEPHDEDLDEIEEELEEEPECEDGSVIECQNQTLGESVAITGSAENLVYRSDRVPDRHSTRKLTIPLTGGVMPSSLRRVRLEIEVAGQRYTQEFDAQINLVHEYVWNGLDGFGRQVSGLQPADVRIGYVYGGVYNRPVTGGGAFGRPGGPSITGNRSRQEVTLWREYETAVGKADPLDLKGWSLSSHHLYDPIRRTINFGYGGTQGAQDAANATLTTVAGDGNAAFDGDGGPALEASMAPFGLDFGPDGTLYFADDFNHRVRKISPDGTVETVAGSGEQGFGGDGGPATSARLSSPRDVAIGPDGSLYITDSHNQRIRKVSPGGVIETVAGTGEAGFGGDNGPATDASLDSPFGIDVGPDGTVYFGDSFNRRIRQITPDGRISTIAGTGVFGYSGDGGPATEADLIVKFLSYGPDGSLYFSDDQRVRRIRPDGIIETVAGNGDFLPPPPFDDVEGHNATDVMLGGILGLTVAPDGSVFTLEETWPRIRRVTPEGIIVTVAGTGDVLGSSTLPADGQARRQNLHNSLDIALSPDGALYFSSYTYIRKVENAYPGFSEADYLVPSDNGEELYRFDYAGRHLQTLDAVTGEVIREFEYDDQGRLASIIEAGDAVTLLERDSTGTLTAIGAPDGQRTELVVDENDNLRSVINPAGEAYSFDYTDGGLLTQKTTPNSHVHFREYDDVGHLESTLDPENGGWLLSRDEIDSGYEAMMTSAEGRATRYQVVSNKNGDRVRTNTYPDGTVSTRVFRPDASQQVTARDGTITERVQGADPRFGMRSPVPERRTMTTPAERTLDVRTSREATLADSSDPLSVEQLVETVTINGDDWVTEHDVPAAQVTQTTPEGRATISEVDSLRRPLRTQTADLAPWQFERDARGRLTGVTHGTQDPARTTVFEYGSDGFLSRVTDPLGRSVDYEYDAAGRITRQTLPSGSEIEFNWDADGNLRTIVPPGREAHQFEYTGVDLDESYEPPALDGVDTITRYTWNRDRDLRRIDYPDGRSLVLDYNEGGQLEFRTTPRGTTGYHYHQDTGQLIRMDAPDGDSLHYSHDGPLLLEERWQGVINAGVQRDYDNRLRLSELRIDDAATINLGYDRDNLLTQAGDLTLAREPDTGLLAGTTLGSIATNEDYNAFAEPVARQATHSGDNLYHAEYERDDLGRITEKRETVGGQTITESYTYDAHGRLETATRNGAQVNYTYDANGNRLSRNNTAGTYDAQDRLLTWGNNSYEYTDNGDLLSKTTPQGTSAYDYDILGNLRSVTLPDSTEIDYLIDARNRRIGKQVDGELQWGLIYQDQLNPVARTDAEGNIDQIYVYGSKGHVPDYMVYGGETYRFITDHLGSVRLVVNTDTGEIAQRIDYDEFGRVLNDTNPGFQPFGFAGGLYDVDTGLVRFGARDYDPETGRWTAKDPIGFGGSDTNLYGYVVSDPVNWIDPHGARRQPTAPGGGRGTAGNPRPTGQNYSGQPGAWHQGKFYPSMGQPTTQQPSTRQPLRDFRRQNEFGVNDLLPHPGDWHDFFEGQDIEEEVPGSCPVR